MNFYALVFVALVGLAVFSSPIADLFGLGSLTSYDSVYKANWGHICCVQSDDYDIVYTRYADDQSTSSCSDYTNECYYSFTYGNKPWTMGAGANVCYKINGGSTQSLSWGSVSSITLPVGSTIQFVSCGLNQDARPYYQYTKKAKTFYIEGEENGKIFTSESCVLNSALKQRVLSSGLNELQKSGANKCQNYVTDFILTATKTYSYNGQLVVCQARQLYAVTQSSFKDGSVVKIQGDYITGVSCCPSESNCGDDFKWHTDDDPVDRECTYSTECSNGGDPVALTGTTAVKYVCQNGKCVQGSQFVVECTNNAICIALHGSTSVCDLSPSNWGNCITRTENSGYCGDGVCESLLSETATSCPADCGVYSSSSKWWQNIPWYAWLLIIVFLLVFARNLLKMIPGVKWFIP